MAPVPCYLVSDSLGVVVYADQEFSRAKRECIRMTVTRLRHLLKLDNRFAVATDIELLNGDASLKMPSQVNDSIECEWHRLYSLNASAMYAVPFFMHDLVMVQGDLFKRRKRVRTDSYVPESDVEDAIEDSQSV